MKNKILLAVAEDSVREHISNLLAWHGYHITGVDSGLKAIDSFKETLPDLVICETDLPDINGYNVFLSLFPVLFRKKIPFVYITSKSNQRGGKHIMYLGAENFDAETSPGSDILSGLKQTLNSVYNFQGPV